MSKLAYYREILRFDLTKYIPFTKSYRIGCSQCEAMAINGMPCHETGCPHATHECKGCYEQIPKGQKYCESCRH